MKAEITPCDGSGSKTWLDRRKMARFARCSATFAYKIGHIENCWDGSPCCDIGEMFADSILTKDRF